MRMAVQLVAPKEKTTSHLPRYGEVRGVLPTPIKMDLTEACVTGMLVTELPMKIILLSPKDIL